MVSKARYGRVAGFAAALVAAVAIYIIAVFVIYPNDSKASGILESPLYGNSQMPLYGDSTQTNAGSPVASTRVDGTSAQFPESVPNMDVLFDQTYAMGTDAITSQQYEPELSAFTNQAADDFEVPAGQTWNIERIDVAGTYISTRAAESVNVYFYADTAATREPGAPVMTQTHILPVVGLLTGNFQIELTQPVYLPAGRYWVSVQAQLDFGTRGQWFWRTHNFSAAVAEVAYWRNPGNGFHRNNCTVWHERWNCQAIQVRHPNRHSVCSDIPA